MSVAAVAGLSLAGCGSKDTAASPGLATSTTVAVTVPVESTVVTTTAVPEGLPEDILSQLQLDCVYGGSAAACDSLVLAGYPSTGNYGLGNSLTQAPDAALVEKCNGGWRLMCAELLDRYPATNGVPPGGEEVPAAPVLSGEEVVSLQLDCIYGGSQAACDELIGAGYSPGDNYGLGNSYSQAPDESLAADCSSFDLFACAEMASRYAPASGDDVVARNFVTALITGSSLDGLAPQYLIAQVTGPAVGITTIDEANFGYSADSGVLEFSLDPTTSWQCYVGAGLVRRCAYLAD
jgi:hypothetical protein